MERPMPDPDGVTYYGGNNTLKRMKCTKCEKTYNKKYFYRHKCSRYGNSPAKHTQQASTHGHLKQELSNFVKETCTKKLSINDIEFPPDSSSENSESDSDITNVPLHADEHHMQVIITFSYSPRH